MARLISWGEEYGCPPSTYHFFSWPLYFIDSQFITISTQGFNDKYSLEMSIERINSFAAKELILSNSFLKFEKNYFFLNSYFFLIFHFFKIIPSDAVTKWYARLACALVTRVQFPAASIILKIFDA